MKIYTFFFVNGQKSILSVLVFLLVNCNFICAQISPTYNDNDFLPSFETSQEQAKIASYGTIPGSKYAYYSNLKNWIPMDNGNPIQHTPPLIINISFHIFLDNGGGNCWFTDDVIGRERLLGHLGLLGVVNRIYNRAEFPASDIVPGVVEIPNISSRIQFSAGSQNERVYFYRDSYLNTNKNLQSTTALQKHPECTNTMNVYISAAIYNPLPSATGSANGNEVSLYKCAPAYQGTDLNTDLWIYGFTLGHEFGHNLNLRHTYCPTVCCLGTCAPNCEKITSSHPDYLEYMSDIFGPISQATCPHIHDWSFSPYDNTHPLNIKNTNNLLGGSNAQVYISPMQVGQMHRALALYSVGKYVHETSFSPIPLVVKQNEVWDFELRLFRNLQITKGLSLYRDVILPKMGKVEVLAGGKLIIKEALTLQNDIIVRKGGALIIEKDLNFIGANRIQIDSGAYFCIHPTATINLKEALSVLNLQIGYILGAPSAAISIKPLISPGFEIIPVEKYTCTSSIPSIRKTGLGKINTFGKNICICGTILSGSQYYSANSITLSNICQMRALPYRGVSIPNGSSIILSAEGSEGVLLEKEVTVELGGTLEIK